MKNNVLKKVLQIAGDVLIALFIGLMLFISITNIRAKQTNGLPNIFGTGYLNVLSESMDDGSKDAIKVGDMVVVEVVNTKNSDKVDDLKVGDIITYYDNSEEKIISHRIIEKHELAAGNYYFVVQGDNPLAAGQTTNVYAGEVLGIYKKKINGMGKVFNWVSHGWGFFIIIVGPCIAFLVYEVFKFIKALGEYNHERNQELDEDADYEKKIEMRKEVLAGLVNDGTLTQEQADQKFKEFKEALDKERAEKEAAQEPEEKKETEEAK